MRWWLAIAVLACAGATACAQDNSRILLPERTIALPHVAGRIDHLAIDPAHKRLAVAELGNNSVDIVDTGPGAVLHRIVGLKEPQGIAFDQSGKVLVVATRGDGTAHFFNANTYAELGTLALGADADNVRIDQRNDHAVIGYGDGALAVIDIDRRATVSRTALPAHPESFQLDGGRAYVNLPDARTIGMVDLDKSSLEARWRLPGWLWNFPLALDPQGSAVASVFRGPARLALFDPSDGSLRASAATCGDSDDVFFDMVRRRLYVACGAGHVDVFSLSPLRRLGRVPTSAGARTALFVPELDRLFVAIRARANGDAAILVLRPA